MFRERLTPNRIALTNSGTILGSSVDAARTSHGFIRSSGGDIVTFSLPDAGSGGGLGTFPSAINSGGAVVRSYADQGGVWHSFLRSADGTLASFDPPGASLSGAIRINASGAGRRLCGSRFAPIALYGLRGEGAQRLGLEAHVSCRHKKPEDEQPNRDYQEGHQGRHGTF